MLANSIKLSKIIPLLTQNVSPEYTRSGAEYVDAATSNNIR